MSSTNQIFDLPDGRRLGTTTAYAEHRGCHERTVRNHLTEGHYRGYQIEGVPGTLIDFAEADAKLAALPATRVRHHRHGTFGPKAQIVQLPASALPPSARPRSRRVVRVEALPPREAQQPKTEPPTTAEIAAALPDLSEAQVQQVAALLLSAKPPVPPVVEDEEVG